MKKILFILSLSVTLFGCYEDKTSYDFSPTEEFIYPLQNYGFPNALVGEEYVFDLNLPDSLFDSFDFQWESNYADSLTVYTKGDVLIFTPSEAGRLSVRFVAIEKKTQTYTQYLETTIEILNNYADNLWLVLGECEGEEGISLIEPESEIVEGLYNRTGYKVTKNMSTNLPANPKKFHLGFNKGYYDYDLKAWTMDVSILLESGTSEYNFIRNRYPYDIAVPLNENIINMPDDYEFKSYYEMNGKSMMISTDGTLYKKVKEKNYPFNYSSPYYQADYYYNGEIYKFVEILDPYSQRSTWSYYDLPVILESPEGVKSLKYISVEDDLVVVDYSEPIAYEETTLDKKIDLDNIGDWEVIHATLMEWDEQYIFFKKGDVIRQATIRRAADYSRTNHTIEAVFADFPMPELFEGDFEVYFQYSCKYYFAKGSEIYIYDPIDYSIQKFYTVPSGDNVTAISMNAHENEMIIGTDKGAIYIINGSIDLTISDEDRLLETIEGFTKITDIAYRYYNTSFYQYAKYGASDRYWD